MVGRDVRIDVSLDAQEEKAALRHEQCDLSDDLLKALLEELFTDGADPTLTGLPLHQFLVELLSQAGHVDTVGSLSARLLHPVFSCLQNHITSSVRQGTQ